MILRHPHGVLGKQVNLAQPAGLLARFLHDLPRKVQLCSEPYFKKSNMWELLSEAYANDTWLISQSNCVKCWLGPEKQWEATEVKYPCKRLGFTCHTSLLAVLRQPPTTNPSGLQHRPDVATAPQIGAAKVFTGREDVPRWVGREGWWKSRT